MRTSTNPVRPPDAVECLAKLSRWQIGGPASAFLRADTVDGLATLIGKLTAQGTAFIVIGSTSNLLFADEGLDVTCIQIAEGLDGFTVEDDDVVAQAGLWVPGFARKVMQEGLSGAEHICGIPGTLGGLIHMNGGSQRKSIGDSIINVTSIDAKGNLHTRPRSECGFAYRSSIYQKNAEVIVSARFRFKHGVARSHIRQEMLGILGDRRRKFPKNEPNCGSVFISNPALYQKHGPPGAVIERLGFKGTRIGNAEISRVHANWISNKGGATATDVLALVHLIKTKVQNTTGFALQAEAKYVTPDGRFVPLDVAAALFSKGEKP